MTINSTSRYYCVNILDLWISGLDLLNSELYLHCSCPKQP